MIREYINATFRILDCSKKAGNSKEDHHGLPYLRLLEKIYDFFHFAYDLLEKHFIAHNHDKDL